MGPLKTLLPDLFAFAALLAVLVFFGALISVTAATESGLMTIITRLPFESLARTRGAISRHYVDVGEAGLAEVAGDLLPQARPRWSFGLVLICRCRALIVQHELNE